MDASSISVAELLPQGPEAVVIDALVEHRRDAFGRGGVHR